MENKLYLGNNLDVLRRLEDESVDLTYIDAPWNDNPRYNILFTDHSGEQAPTQIKTFQESWSWDKPAIKAYKEVVKSGGSISTAMEAFHTLIGENDMLAFLAMMSLRLIEVHRVSKSTGSIYLHCDPTISYYLRILMDSVFGLENFRNGIAWCYTRLSKDSSHYPRQHATILFYTKSKQYTFNAPHIPYAKTTKLYSSVYGVENPAFDEEDRLKEGKIVEDWWIDIPALSGKMDISYDPPQREHLGYPTQKPKQLLKRIIEVSSNPGDVVLDLFLGTGTTIAVAQELDRQWIGIDVADLAITLTKYRLGNDAEYKVERGAEYLLKTEELAKSNPYQFRYWVSGLIKALPISDEKRKKNKVDKRVSSKIYFNSNTVDKKKEKQEVIISIEVNNTDVSHVRGLKTAMKRERAQIGVLICMKKPTKFMKIEAESAGFYKSQQGKHPRLQIITVAELLDGTTVDYPINSREV